MRASKEGRDAGLIQAEIGERIFQVLSEVEVLQLEGADSSESASIT